MSRQRRLPPPNNWMLISEGIEGSLRSGLYRAYKHVDGCPSEEQVERIVEEQSLYIMSWFAEHYRFDP